MKTGPRARQLESATAETAYADSTLVLHLLGRPRWQRWSAQHPQSAEFALNWRDAALLAVLSLDGAQPRDRLAMLLWPSAPSLQAARLSLRQRLHKLRSATGHELVHADEALQICSDGVECDLWPLQWERTGHWPEGRLLEGMDGLPDTHEVLAGWVQQARQQFSLRWQSSLGEACRKAELACDYVRTARLCRQWLRHWPWSEEQWRRLIEALYLGGELAEAANAITRMQQVLTDELGVPLSASTLRLVDTAERAFQDRRRVLATGQDAPRRHAHTLTDAAAPIGRDGLARSADVRLVQGVEAFLRSLSPEALMLGRALALLDAADPCNDRVLAASAILQVPALSLAPAWQELEDAGVALQGSIADTTYRKALLHSIPPSLRQHLLARLSDPGRPSSS